MVVIQEDTTGKDTQLRIFGPPEVVEKAHQLVMETVNIAQSGESGPRSHGPSSVASSASGPGSQAPSSGDGSGSYARKNVGEVIHILS